MSKRPWLAPSLLLLVIGLIALAQSSTTIPRVAGGLAVFAGLLFLVAGEVGGRRR